MSKTTSRASLCCQGELGAYKRTRVHKKMLACMHAQAFHCAVKMSMVGMQAQLQKNLICFGGAADFCINPKKT